MFYKSIIGIFVIKNKFHAAWDVYDDNQPRTQVTQQKPGKDPFF
jgi:hypothetical protein